MMVSKLASPPRVCSASSDTIHRLSLSRTMQRFSPCSKNEGQSSSRIAIILLPTGTFSRLPSGKFTRILEGQEGGGFLCSRWKRRRLFDTPRPILCVEAEQQHSHSVGRGAATQQLDNFVSSSYFQWLTRTYLPLGTLFVEEAGGSRENNRDRRKMF